VEKIWWLTLSGSQEHVEANEEEFKEHIWTSTFEPQMFDSGTDHYERQNSQCNQIFTFIIKWLACNDSSLTTSTPCQQWV
jgi:hypothetical protein